MGTSSFGDEYLSFWANGSFNLCLNNCLFSNPTGAPDLFDEQLRWMDEKLAYARENDATHIFVYGHFPWFLKHEEEADDELTSHSSAPSGWGPPGTKFEDGYFTIPYEYRKIAMAMFKKYDVTACFSGHFHQNVTAQSSWGMVSADACHLTWVQVTLFCVSNVHMVCLVLIIYQLCSP